MTTSAAAETIVVPQPDELTAPYWDAAKRHELVVQRCSDCGKLRFPPSVNCPRCYSEKVEWQPVAGTGTLFTYIWIHQAFQPQFQDKLPYNVVQVVLDEDPNLIITGNVVDVPLDELKVGLPVKVVFDDVTPTDTIPRWELVR